MSTPREQYDAMLDTLDNETKMSMIDHCNFARVLEALDAIAYRCGQADFMPTCDKCGHEFTADDHDAEAICDDCREEDEDDEGHEEDA